MIVAGSLVWLASAAGAVPPDLLAAVHAYDAAHRLGRPAGAARRLSVLGFGIWSAKRLRL